MLNCTNLIESLKGKMFNNKACDFRGLTPDITRELLNKDLDYIDMQGASCLIALRLLTAINFIAS